MSSCPWNCAGCGGEITEKLGSGWAAWCPGCTRQNDEKQALVKPVRQDAAGERFCTTDKCDVL